jgi:hypothetical protein
MPLPNHGLAVLAQGLEKVVPVVNVTPGADIDPLLRTGLILEKV